VIAPGADPKAIRLAFQGARKISLSSAGDLVLDTKEGKIQLKQLRVYQKVNGEEKKIAARYVLKGKRRVAFEVAEYDRRQPLVIDPVLSYSTYLGGSGREDGAHITVDSSGNAYVVGDSFDTNFPTTSGAFQTTFGGGYTNAFVTKLNPTGSALAYSTYLGTSENYGYGIAVDASGNAYVAGLTSSTNFPTTLGTFQTTNGGGRDAFVTKLNPAGSALVYSTYLGGSLQDYGYNIGVDASGNAYVAGSTSSTNFPTTPGAFQTTDGGGNDAYVTKLNPTGSALVYSTYLGGNSYDDGTGIGVDASGNAYVAGSTSSTNFPTTPGTFQTTYGGGSYDVYVAKLNPAGSALTYSTYLGGNSQDINSGIVLDASSNVYVTGSTSSSNFPTTSGAYQTTFGGGYGDVFVAKFTPSYSAQIQQPINPDGTSVFNVRRGVVPVKFTLTQDGVATCALPPATIAVTRTAGGTIGAIDEMVYSGSADTGSNFRIDSCQYVYNLSASALGVGTYRVDIMINGTVVGSAIFQLK
jgi:hypothetical protein